MNVAELEAERDRAIGEGNRRAVPALNEKIYAAKMLEALETERASYVSRSKPDRVAEVDAQIAFWCKKLGTKPPKRETPAKTPAETPRPNPDGATAAAAAGQQTRG